MRPSRTPEGDEGEVRLGTSDRTRAAGDALRALARASRSYLIYDASNAAVRGFIEEVRATFQRYFDAYGDLELVVRPFELMLEGEAVYLERDRERSLALKLFRDGVRKVTLARSTDWGELARLLEIVSIRFVGVRMNEDDVVTLLWKAGFANIRIEAVEGFVPDDNDEQDANMGPSIGRQSAEQIFGSDDEASAGGTGAKGAKRSSIVADSAAGQRVPDDFDVPAPRLPPPVRVQYIPIGAAEVEALRAEADSTHLPEATLVLTRELLAAASEPTDPLGFDDMENFCREVRDFLLAEDRLDALLVLFDELTRFREQQPGARERVDALLAGFVDTAAVRRLVRSVPKDATEPPERLYNLLKRVPGDVLAVFFELLESERDDHSRRIVRFLIGQQLPARTPAVLARFRASTGPVAADLLRVIAAAAPEAATDLLSSLMTSSDTEVQHEFLRLSTDFASSPSLRGLLAMMLQATALDVRDHTLDVIASRGEKGAFPTVQRHAEVRAEADASPGEMATIGKALARIDPPRALELFKEWAQPRGFFQKIFTSKPHKLRGHAALWGLAAVGGDEAVAALQSVYTKGESELREAARAVMASLKGAKNA